MNKNNGTGGVAACVSSLLYGNVRIDGCMEHRGVCTKGKTRSGKRKKEKKTHLHRIGRVSLAHQSSVISSARARLPGVSNIPCMCCHLECGSPPNLLFLSPGSTTPLSLRYGCQETVAVAMVMPHCNILLRSPPADGHRRLLSRGKSRRGGGAEGGSGGWRSDRILGNANHPPPQWRFCPSLCRRQCSGATRGRVCVSAETRRTRAQKYTRAWLDARVPYGSWNKAWRSNSGTRASVRTAAGSLRFRHARRFHPRAGSWRDSCRQVPRPDAETRLFAVVEFVGTFLKRARLLPVLRGGSQSVFFTDFVVVVCRPKQSRQEP